MKTGVIYIHLNLVYMKQFYELEKSFCVYPLLSYVFSVLMLLMFSLPSKAQQDKLSLSLRMPLQFEFHKIEIVYGPDEVKKNTAFNFGLESLLEYSVSPKLSFYAGVGYFRQRFDIQRQFDHQALNPGVDSLPYGSATEDYTYHLMRLPIGLRYSFLQRKSSPNVAFEYIPGFAFHRVYNGWQFAEGANKKRTDFGLFSHALIVSTRVSLLEDAKKAVSIEPYVRILHRFRKDAIFFEDKSESVARMFDALGLSFNFRFKSRH